MKETFNEGLGVTTIKEKPLKRPNQIKSIASAVATATVALICAPSNAKAKEIPVAEFGPEINEMMVKECNQDPPFGTGPGALMQGAKSERFRMIFDGVNTDCTQAAAAEEFKVLDGPNNGIIIRSLGNPIAMPEEAVFIDGEPWPCGFIEVDRGDGRDAKVAACDDKIFKDGEVKWEKTIIDGGEDFGKWYTDFYAIHQCATAKNHIKLTNAGLFFDPASDDLIGGTFRIDIKSSNYYDAIQKAINDAWEKEGKDPYEAGLLKHVEDGALRAPETDRLLLIDDDTLLRFDPQTEEYFYLQRSEDGIYTPENPQIGKSDWLSITGSTVPFEKWFGPVSMVKITTTGNRKIHLTAGGGLKKDWMAFHGVAKIVALEELTDEQGEIYFKEVPIAIDFNDQYPDDDGDGKVNHEDNCRWRANPDQVNSTADENGDACKANCTEGGWPGVDVVPLQTNASGLRVCQSELGFNFAFSFEDGSTIHSNMDVEIAGGKIMLKPGQVVRIIHSWDPRTEKLSALNISLPAGNSVKIKVHSAKNLDGISGQTVFTHDGTDEYFNGTMDWQEFPVLGTDGEIENGSDIEIEVGNENPVPSVETEAEPAQAEPAQAEESAKVELPAPAEPAQAEPPAQVELPNAAEQPSIVETPVVVEPTPDVFSGNPEPDATAETAEETGFIIPPVEPQQPEPQVETAQAEPTVEQIVEAAPDVIQSLDTYDVAQDTAQNPDTPPTSPDILPDTPQNPDTPPLQDTPMALPDTSLDTNADTLPPDTAQPDTSPAKDSMPDTSQVQLDTNQPDASKPSQKDTENSQPKPEEKSEGGGGGCNCAIENPNNNSSAEIFTMFGAAIATWFINRRRQLKKILTRN